MTALVARVAGCNEVSLFFPSSSEEAKKLMLATAYVAEINHAYNFGVSLLKQYQFTSRASQIVSISKIQTIT